MEKSTSLFMKSAIAMGCAFMLSVSAQAALTLMGTFDPDTPASEASEAAAINTLLPMAINTTQSVALPAPPPNKFVVYVRSGNSLIGSSSVTAIGASKINSPTVAQLTVSGYEYVLGKYGTKAVVWHLGFGSEPLPATYDGHGISHLTAFTPVPEPSTYVAGALLLAPVFMQVRRWKRSA
jgi:hypothetical protein